MHSRITPVLCVNWGYRLEQEQCLMVEQDKIFEKIKLTVLEFCDLLFLRTHNYLKSSSESKRVDMNKGQRKEQSFDRY